MRVITNLLIGLFVICFVLGCKQHNSNSSDVIKNPVKIIIQPLGTFPESYLKSVQSNLQKIYPNIEIKKSIDFPESSLNYNNTRYRADTLIKYLKRRNPKNSITIGLTTKDISTSKGNKHDWGVMGLGYRPGESCIASSYRLKGKKEEKLFKVAIHELGHTQGLKHCPIKNCFMRDAEGKDHLDEETNFCEKCRKILQNNGWKLK